MVLSVISQLLSYFLLVNRFKYDSTTVRIQTTVAIFLFTMKSLSIFLQFLRIKVIIKPISKYEGFD